MQRQRRGVKQGEVEHCCKHCETVLSGTIVMRLKTYLLNGNPCKKFLQSPEAAELTKEVEEVKAALVYTPKASSSELERSLTYPYMFQVRTGASKLKVAERKMCM